ncbi:MAG TPA: response regulator transcription factor [Ottowia sp.]|uniref:response regulator transcription factor n=1 Tax=Ottowia sp. TaxID=1898956 RepID=UPI002B6EEA2E|nr:response regulator transcription factor [Ottowia sp.]HMN20960.1 response regulator transcription factor [Ottowia sp.]
MPTSDADARDAVLIVDDHELVRLGLSTLLAAQAGAGAPAVLEASSLAQALRLYGAREASIALVLLDLHLPDAHGLSGLREFLARFPDARVVALSGDNDPGLVRDAIAAGAVAYLSKSGQMAEVVEYVQALARHRIGGTAALGSAEATGSGRVVHTNAGERLQLTSRQAQLLDLVLTGHSNQEIAVRLHLAEGTVKNHVSALLLLFGVRSRAQLISRLR